MTKASKRNLRKNPSGITMPEGQPAPANRHIITEQFAFQGPIPHPSILAGYEQVLPGAADRIISLAESETKHRHEMEKKILDAEIAGNRSEVREVLMGQVFAFIIALSTIGSGAYTAVNGAQFAGSIIGTAGVSGLVYVFIMGRKNPKNNNQSPEK